MIIGIILFIVGLIVGGIGYLIIEENTMTWGKLYSTDMRESNEEMILLGQITVWIGICINLIGLVLGISGYLIKEKIQPQSKAPSKFCTNCGRSICFNDKVCPYCGKKMMN
jgi:hypothetical protein